MIDIRQTQEYANYLKREGWIVERIDGVNYFIRRILIVGSILKIQRPEKLDLALMIRIIRAYKVYQVIVEPKDKKQAEILVKNGFRLAKSTYLPSKTLQIDLTQPKEKIFRKFKKDARQAIRKSYSSHYDSLDSLRVGGGQGITIRQYSTPNEIKIFRKAWKKSVNLRRWVPGETQLVNLRKSFPQYKSLFLASHNIIGRIIGGAIFTTSSHDRSNYIMYYWQAFTNSEGRTSLSQYSLLWYAILWAKKHKYKVFDFEGIYDPRFPNKSWLGFTHFKRSFGGQEVSYPGCFVKFRLPL